LNVLAGLWGAYLLAAPTVSLFWSPSWHDEQRAGQIALVVVSAVACVWMMWTKSANRLPRLNPLLLGFLLLGTVSAAFSGFVFAAMAEVAWIFLLAVLVLLSAAFFASDPLGRVNWLYRLAFMIAATHVFGVGARILVSIRMLGALDPSAFVLGFSNPRFESALHVMLVPLLVLIVTNSEERPLFRLMAWFLATGLVCISCALGTRAFWFDYLIAIPLIFFAVGWSKAKRFLGSIVPILVVGIVIYIALTVVISAWWPETSGLPPPMRDASLNNRGELWLRALTDFRSSPLLGIGPAQFAATPNRRAAHPHNWLLQLLGEWGLPATIAFCLFTAMFFVTSRRRIMEEARADLSNAMLATTAVVLIALLNGLVDGNLLMPISQSFAALVLGAAITLNSTSIQRRSAWVTSSFWRMIFLIAVAASVATVATYAVESYRLQEAGIAEFHRHYSGKLLPRFWEQGIIAYPTQ
jgi:O-antigen ligase